MNIKAQQFIKYLEDNQYPWFSYEELNDTYHSVIFRGHLEVGKVELPMLVILDDSLFSSLRIGVYMGRIASTRRGFVERYLGELNSRFKAFKYYVLEEEAHENIVLDISLPCTSEDFNPDMILYLLREVTIPHLNDALEGILDVVKVKRAPRKTSGKASLKTSGKETAKTGAKRTSKKADKI